MMLKPIILPRVARPAPAAWNIAKTLAQTAVFWAVFLVLLPALIWHLETRLGLERFRFTSPHWRWAGVMLFSLAGTLSLSSGIIMAAFGDGTPLPLDSPRRLVLAGPYRFVRNPMAIAGIAQGVAVGLFMGSPSIILYALLGAPMWHLFVRPWEERDLASRFGEQYERYRSAVRCWIPQMRRYCDPSA